MEEKEHAMVRAGEGGREWRGRVNRPCPFLLLLLYRKLQEPLKSMRLFTLQDFVSK